MSGSVNNEGRLQPPPVRAPPQYYIPWDPADEWCKLIDQYLRANCGPQNPSQNPRQDGSNGSHAGSSRPGPVSVYEGKCSIVHDSSSSLSLSLVPMPSSSAGTGIHIGSVLALAAPAPRSNPVIVNGQEQSKKNTKTKTLKVKKVKMVKAEPKPKKPKTKKRAGVGEFVPEMYTGSFAAAAATAVAVKEMPNEFTVDDPLVLTDVGAEVEIGAARIAALHRRRGFEKKYRTALRELRKHPFNPDHKTQAVLEVENLIEKQMSTEEEGNENQIMVSSGEGEIQTHFATQEPQQSQNAPNSGPPESALVLPVVPVSPTKQPKSKSKKKKKSSAPKRVRLVVPKKVPAKKLRLIVPEESNEDEHEEVVKEVQPLRQDVPSPSNPAGTHHPQEHTHSTPPSTPVPVSNVVVGDANRDGKQEKDADKENVPPPQLPADPEKTNDNDTAKPESEEPKQELAPPRPEDDADDGASIQKPLTRSQAKKEVSKGVGKWVPVEINGGVHAIFKRVCKK